MQNLLRNLRFSARMLRKYPGLTIAVLLTLALGVGANTAIFTVDYATLLQPLPYPHPKQLVMVWARIKNYHNLVSLGDYVDWKRESKSFQDLNVWTDGTFNMATRSAPQQIDGTYVTPGYFQMLGLPMFMGRSFVPAEGIEGQDHSVILKHKFWKRLGSDPHILGKTLRLNGEPYTVVGVLPAGLYDREEGDVALPFSFKPIEATHDFRWLMAMGRLKPGVTLAQARADMDAVTARVAQAYPKDESGWGAFVEPLKNDFIPKDRIRTLWMLLGAVGFVLLIACVNVANLLLASSMARQKEMAVRSSLGATPKAIFSQLLTESLLLALAGGALGVGVGYGMLHGLIAAMPPNTLPSNVELSLNVPVLLFTLGATTLAGLLFGCVPAWYASKVDPGETLKEGARSGTGTGRNRLRRGLVIGEFTLALALLAGAGLTIHSFWNLTHVDLGVRTDHVLTFSLPFPDSRPMDVAHLDVYFRQILDSVRSVPGAVSVSAESGLPLRGTGFGTGFAIEGQPAAADPSMWPGARLGMVTPEYFKTFGIRLLRGREFTGQDTPATVKVAMVNQFFADKFLKGLDPLQQRVRMREIVPGVAKLGPIADWQIVGVFHNVRDTLRRDTPEVLVPFWQSPWQNPSFGVRTAGDPATMTKAVAAAVYRVDPQVALAEPTTMDQVRDSVLASDRFTFILFASFAGIALLLAAMGIYGVMTFSVAQRSHELALRLALGASRGRVVGMVVREGIALAAAGLGLGLIGAYFIGRAMQSILYGVSALDFSVFAGVGCVLLAAALLACFVPALKAASTQPMQVLRSE